MMYYLITQRPLQSLAGVLTMLAGLVLFALSGRPVPAGGVRLS
jgi:APA family basic amino acid/polyamine antiporter